MISIRGTQAYENEKPEMIELITAGTLRRQNNDYLITYKESQLTGLEGTTTTLKVSHAKNIVTLTRSGATSTQLVFERGCKHLAHYDTGMGALTIGVSASKVNAELSDDGGDIEIKYALEIDCMVAGENTFTVSIRDPGGTGTQPGSDDDAKNGLTAGGKKCPIS